MNKQLLAQEIAVELYKQDLPHLYGLPHYTWSREFFESVNKNNLLCAANQLGKSTVQIRKCIHWATEEKLWPYLWKNKPNLFWYMYPSQPVLEDEFQTKWIPLLPAGSMKEHPKYGWEEVRTKGALTHVKFNSGILLTFKLYSQRAINLQAASVFAMFCDEEMPVEFHSELMNRMNATDGYFHMVFTATLGQDYWRKALEPGPREKEELIGAWKMQVSLYDSMVYADGTPSHWTEERITQVKARCKDHNEVQKRVYGKFILSSGRKYASFDATRHMKERHPLPANWLIYVGADPGSGGEKGHQAALCYVAVRPDFRSGRVFRGWRGDNVVTDNSYVVKKHIEIKTEMKMTPSAQYYDWASRDFQIVAQGLGETFIPAEKSHDLGEDVINTLFKNDMMFIYEDAELAKLAGELSTLKADTPKKHAKDNFADAFRYAITRIPWDFSFLNGPIDMQAEVPEKPLNDTQRQIRDRRKGMFDEDDPEKWQTCEEEMEEWNELAGG